MTDPNERMARLLGWERDPAHKWHYWTRGDEFCLDEPPDYTQWERFPEMQEYVRGMGREKRSLVLYGEFLRRAIDFPPLLNITPTILRDAILEVCDD
jgi:hypothetical protein